MRRNSIRNLGVFPVACLLSACLFDSKTQWRDGEFEVSWIDESEARSVYYGLSDGGGPSVVNQTVIAVGNDETYIVVKRRDERNLVSYYYIDKSDESKIIKGADIAKGPFSKSQFQDYTKQLKLPPFEKFFD